MTLPAPRANPRCLGHDAVFATFERALASDRLPHAWLLVGPPGIGKATTGFALARRLLAKPDEVADDADSAIFRQVAQHSHPDLTVLERRPHPKTGKLQTEIVVDAVRDAIDAMHRTTAWQGRRVLLIDAIDDLNRNAENALLKILEEPLPGTVIILICHSPGSVPRTLLSRCAQLRLRPPPPAITEQLLANAFPEANAAERQCWTEFAQGSPGRAMICREHELLEHYRRLLDAVGESGPAVARALAEANRLSKFVGEVGISIGCEPLYQLARRAAIVAGGGALYLELVEDEKARLAAITLRLPLEHWLGMWDKLSSLPGRIDGLNLDSNAMLFSALRALMGDEVRDMAI